MRKIKLLAYTIVCHIAVHTFFLPIYIIMLCAWLLDFLTFGIYFRKSFARWWFGKDKVSDDGEINL